MPGKYRAMGIGLGLLGGILTGAAIGLLYAPKRGTETRQLVKQKATQMGNQAVDMASKVADQVSKGVQQMSTNKPSSETPQNQGEGSSSDTGNQMPSTSSATRNLPVSRPDEIQTQEASHPRQRHNRRGRSATAVQVPVRQVQPQVEPPQNQNIERVVDTNGQDVGKLEGVMLDSESGKIVYGVIALENGENAGKMCAVPWPALKEERDRYTLEIAPDRMERTIVYARQSMPRQEELDAIDAVYDYYGYTHFWQKKRDRESPPAGNLD
jgi:gas vesicle protein/sporulation protein YlmC with PRC-barrel domain